MELEKRMDVKLCKLEDIELMLTVTGAKKIAHKGAANYKSNQQCCLSSNECACLIHKHVLDDEQYPCPS